MEVEISWLTWSCIPEEWYEANQAMEIFDEKTKTTYEVLSKNGKLGEARKLCSALWKEHLIDGRFWEGYKLYIIIGRKPVV